MEIKNIEVITLTEEFHSFFYEFVEMDVTDIDSDDVVYVIFNYHNFKTPHTFDEEAGEEMGFQLSFDGDEIIFNEVNYTYFLFDFVYDFKLADELMQYLFKKDYFQNELNNRIAYAHQHGTTKEQDFLEKLSKLIKENEKIPFVLHEEKRKEVEKIRLRNLMKK